MYRKYFFKSKGVLSSKFVASGLAAVFSAGMFGSYAGAMEIQLVVNTNITNSKVNVDEIAKQCVTKKVGKMSVEEFLNKNFVLGDKDNRLIVKRLYKVFSANKENFINFFSKMLIKYYNEIKKIPLTTLSTNEVDSEKTNFLEMFKKLTNSQVAEGKLNALINEFSTDEEIIEAYVKRDIKDEKGVENLFNTLNFHYKGAMEKIFGVLCKYNDKKLIKFFLKLVPIYLKDWGEGEYKTTKKLFSISNFRITWLFGYYLNNNELHVLKSLISELENENSKDDIESNNNEINEEKNYDEIKEELGNFLDENEIIEKNGKMQNSDSIFEKLKSRINAVILDLRFRNALFVLLLFCFVAIVLSFKAKEIKSNKDIANTDVPGSDGNINLSTDPESDDENLEQKKQEQGSQEQKSSIGPEILKGAGTAAAGGTLSGSGTYLVNEVLLKRGKSSEVKNPKNVNGEHMSLDSDENEVKKTLESEKTHDNYDTDDENADNSGTNQLLEDKDAEEKEEGQEEILESSALSDDTEATSYEDKNKD